MKLSIKSILLLLFITTITYGEKTNSVPSGFLQVDNHQSEKEKVEFLFSIANSYIAEKDYEAALQTLLRTIKLDPEYNPAQSAYAHLCILTKQYAEAEKTLLLLSKRMPNNFSPLNNLSWIYATAEDPRFKNGEKAVEYAHQALVLAPRNHIVWSTLSEAYYASEDYEKALRAIQHMTSLITSQKGVSASEENIDEYNNQIEKCHRAVETKKLLEEAQESGKTKKK